jgi:hypothetical protein
MIRRNLLTTVVLAAAVAWSPSVSFGQGRGNAKPKPNHEDHKSDDQKHKDKGNKHDDSHQTVVFDRDGHVRVIHEYFVAGSLPPGLAKREQLPPGLRAQLHERGELPPGLQKRLIAVPAPLVVKLPAVPSYYHRYFAGDDLIVVDTRTNRIAYVIPDVWR